MAVVECRSRGRIGAGEGAVADRRSSKARTFAAASHRSNEAWCRECNEVPMLTRRALSLSRACLHPHPGVPNALTVPNPDGPRDFAQNNRYLLVSGTGVDIPWHPWAPPSRNPHPLPSPQDRTGTWRSGGTLSCPPLTLPPPWLNAPHVRHAPYPMAPWRRSPSPLPRPDRGTRHCRWLRVKTHACDTNPVQRRSGRAQLLCPGPGARPGPDRNTHHCCGLRVKTHACSTHPSQRRLGRAHMPCPGPGARLCNSAEWVVPLHLELRPQPRQGKQLPRQLLAPRHQAHGRLQNLQQRGSSAYGECLTAAAAAAAADGCRRVVLTCRKWCSCAVHSRLASFQTSSEGL